MGKRGGRSGRTGGGSRDGAPDAAAPKSRSMIEISALDPKAPIIVVGIGNTRTGVATWHNAELKTPQSVETADGRAFEELFAAHCAALDSSTPPPTVIGSVSVVVATVWMCVAVWPGEPFNLTVGCKLPSGSTTTVIV